MLIAGPVDCYGGHEHPAHRREHELPPLWLRARPANNGLCRACHAASHATTSTRAPPILLEEVQNWEMLCTVAHHWSTQEDTDVTLEFFQNIGNIGFTVHLARQSVRYYMKRDVADPVSTESMNRLYEAMGQPEKVVRPETPKKSAWEWIRKPAL